MTDEEYYLEQLKENITLPKEIAEIQIAYIKKFGLKSKEDLYDIETYRTGFNGDVNKSFRKEYVNFFKLSIENNKRVSYEDWNEFRKYPIVTADGKARYVFT
tara:strand:+ start:421 stop:726 length:306 start_codon:yes stop_codon:yes gene_type:complete